MLKPDGTFMYVTYRQPHFMKPLLNCKDVDWDIKVDILGGSESSFDYSGFVLKKKVAPSTGEPAQAETARE